MSTSPSRRLFKVKRGKKEEYIKDEESMIRYLMRMATSRHDRQVSWRQDRHRR